MVDPIIVDDHQYETAASGEACLGIEGLHFAPNRLVRGSVHAATKVVSNTGYVVGYFVTHARDFDYGDHLGLHLGQIDQLTFVANTRRQLTGTFVDCRAGSPSFGRRLVVGFSTSLARRLIIPAGVAHTFKNLGGVVTRNDLRLLGTASREGWRLDDDNVSMPLDISPQQITAVEPNRAPLPRTVALLFYQLQREFLRGDDGREPKPPPVLEVRVAPSGSLGVRSGSNSKFPMASKAWALVPSTPSCVMDMWIVQDLGPTAGYTVHGHHEVLHTFLDRSGERLTLEVIDLRGGSPTFAASASFSVQCSEHEHVRIPAGVAYRYRGVGCYCVRVEAELFVSGDEAQLPTLEADTRTIYPGDPITAIDPPKVPAAPELLLELTEFVSR